MCGNHEVSQRKRFKRRMQPIKEDVDDCPSEDYKLPPLTVAKKAKQVAVVAKRTLIKRNGKKTSVEKKLIVQLIDARLYVRCLVFMRFYAFFSFVVAICVLVSSLFGSFFYPKTESAIVQIHSPLEFLSTIENPT